jgi:hypothetical protein
MQDHPGQNADDIGARLDVLLRFSVLLRTTGVPRIMIACIALCAYAFPVSALVNTGQPVLIVAAFAISIGVIWAAFAGIRGSLFSELFSINCRASGPRDA